VVGAARAIRYSLSKPAHNACIIFLHIQVYLVRLITETMARRHQLTMSSYRLFPNNLPRSGFGNLIALPLQHEPRQAGNSVFLDENIQPHQDQWACLSSLTQMPPSTVESIARKAAEQRKIVGARFDTVTVPPYCLSSTIFNPSIGNETSRQAKHCLYFYLKQ